MLKLRIPPTKVPALPREIEVWLAAKRKLLHDQLEAEAKLFLAAGFTVEELVITGRPGPEADWHVEPRIMSDGTSQVERRKS